LVDPCYCLSLEDPVHMEDLFFSSETVYQSECDESPGVAIFGTNGTIEIVGPNHPSSPGVFWQNGDSSFSPTVW
jgi:hypothetical protein